MWPKFGAKLAAGWMGVVRQGDRLDVAHVVRQGEARPEIRLCDSFQLEGGEQESLQRLAQARNLKRYRYTTLLAESDYRLLQIEAPEVAAEERVQAVRWRLKDAVDFPVDHAAVAIADIPAGSNRQANIFAVAAPHEAVARHMGFFAAAKLPLEAVDIPEMAVRNVAALFEEANRGLAFLMLTGQECLLVLTSGGELYLVRRIDLSARSLDVADDERRLQMLERLALELQRTLDNFDRQFGFISVSQLLVAAEARSDEVVATLSTNLYLPVKAMDLGEVADFPALPELRVPARQAQCLLAIGAALRTSA